MVEVTKTYDDSGGGGNLDLLGISGNFGGDCPVFEKRAEGHFPTKYSYKLNLFGRSMLLRLSEAYCVCVPRKPLPIRVKVSGFIM